MREPGVPGIVSQVLDDIQVALVFEISNAQRVQVPDACGGLCGSCNAS
jgi:hypothetical protein